MKNKKGFFMPTVMVYVCLFTTFMVWITYDSLQYSQLSKSFEQFYYTEEAYYKINKVINKSIDNNSLNECFPNKLYFNNINTENYKISIDGYCLRDPKSTEKIPPSAISANILNESFLNGESELTKLEYDSKETQLFASYEYQLLNDLIGLPVDWELLYGPEYSLIDSADYPLVLKMDRLFVYNVKIKQQNKEIKYMYIYNMDKKKTEQIYVTNY